MSADLLITVECRAENLDLVGDVCRAVARAHLKDEARASRVELATVEACSNIMRYGHPTEPDHPFTIAITADDSGLAMTIRDRGPMFDFHARVMPSFEHALADVPQSGFGIPLVYESVDVVNFARIDDVNELRLFVRRAPRA